MDSDASSTNTNKIRSKHTYESKQSRRASVELAPLNNDNKASATKHASLTDPGGKPLKRGKCLLYSTKGDEAIVVFFTRGDFVCYMSKNKMFPPSSKIGMWFEVDYFITPSGLHITVRSATRIAELISTRKAKFNAELLLRITAVKDYFVSEYGIVSPISDSETKRSIRKKTSGIFAWCAIDIQRHCINLGELDDEEKDGQSQPTTAVQKTAKKSLSKMQPNNFIRGNRSAHGVVCAKSDDYYFIYSRDFEIEVVFDSLKRKDLTLQLGNWIEFEATKDETDESSPIRRVTRVSRVEEYIPTLPCLDTVYIEHDVDVPSNFLTSRNPIQCEFARRVLDDYRLLDKRFVGTTLRVVLGYVYRKPDPCGYWRIETIRRVLRRF